MKIGTYLKLGAGAAVIVLLVVGFLWLRGLIKDDTIELGPDTAIDLTPTQIQSIKAIGEWEFLSVSAEELVDTVRKGIFSDDELVRIYYGTLRLGVNMHHVSPGWLTAENDSISMTLPKITLLDKDFIDEARTKSFFERGTWKAADRDVLYKKAYHQMLKHGLTNENLKAAEMNADQQLRNMMLSMGYRKVSIKFSNQ